MTLHVGVNLTFYYFIWILTNMWITETLKDMQQSDYIIFYITVT